MKLSPKNLSFLLAFLIATFTALFVSLLKNVDTLILLVTFFIAFFSSFLLIVFSLEMLVFSEINELYAAFNKIKKKDFKITKKRISTLATPIEQLQTDIYDYTSQKQKEIDQLIALEAFRREFLADISHELKTPIFAAQGFIHTLLDGAAEDENVRERFLKKAARSLDGLDLLVQDLLMLSQIESGTIKMNFRKVDLVEITKEVFDQLEDTAQERQITLSLTLSSKSSNTLMNANVSENITECMVYADPQRIKQVFTNIIENSIKYGNESGFVKVFLQQNEETCLITIQDNGLGIPSKHLERIFERFYRVEKSRSKERGGTGLGLAIVKQILDAHKATIQVESKANKGTTFTFELSLNAPNK